MKKSLTRIISFMVLLAVSLGAFLHVFSIKQSDGILQMQRYYKLPEDTVDVLFLGSSHAYVNFNNAALWDEYGIASYDLGGSNQPLWNSYYYLKEAVKTQDIKLVVLDAYSVTAEFEYQSEDAAIINNTYGIRLSRNKIDAIKASCPPERKMDFLLDYAQFHTRYPYLERGDFSSDFGGQSQSCNWFDDDWKGQYLLNHHTPIEIADVSGITESAELYPKAESYYRAIIELAQKNGLDIAVVVTPYQIKEEEQKKYLTAERIAKEYGVNFLNCNLNLYDTGLDLNTDYTDDSHMNAPGTVKFSHYIGVWLKANYDIANHKGDSRYASYDRHLEYVKRYIKYCELSDCEDISALSSLMDDPSYLCFASIGGRESTEVSDIRPLLNALGTDGDTSKVLLSTEGRVVWTGDEYYYSNKWHDIALRHDESTGSNEIIIDRQPFGNPDNAVNLVIYDPTINILVKQVEIN